MKSKGGYVYIVSNKFRTVLYIGVTNNLNTRIYHHKEGEGSSFTKKYHCSDLIFFEFFESIEEAIQREKQLKKWKREWKIELIKKQNPKMLDLWDEIDDMR
jgi:putative endonuclease